MPVFGLIVLAAITWQARGILFESGMPVGSDVWHHLARVWYMAEGLKSGGAPPDWFPHWYNGTPLTQYYPPATTYLLAPVQLITGDTTETYRVAIAGALFIAGIGTYAVLLRWVSPPWAALAAVFYAGAPQATRIFYFEASLSRAFFFALLPVLLGLTLRSVESNSRRSFAALALSVFFAVHVHHQQTVLFLSMALFAVGVYAFRSGRAGRLAALKTIAAWGAGLLAASWFLLPALTHFDYADVPNIELIQQVFRNDNLDHLFDPTRGVGSFVVDPYFGLFLSVLTLFVVITRPTRRNLALASAAILAIVLSHGLKTPFFNMYPLPGIVPIRFVDSATILMIFIAADLGSVLRRWRFRPRAHAIALALVVLFFYQDYSPYWQLAGLEETETVEQTLGLFPESDPSSRMEVVLPAVSVSLWKFAPIEQTGWRIPGGFSEQTTPHLNTLVHFNSALSRGQPQFLERTFELWNVRAYAGDTSQQQVVDQLAEGSFSVYAQGGYFTVLSSDLPSNPVMKFDRSMLAVGRGALGIVEAFPWASWVDVATLDKLDPDYADRFDIIFLWDFLWDDAATVERYIRRWVASGKVVLMDMTRMPDPNLFGVRTVIAGFPPNPEMTKGSELDFEFDQPYDVPWTDGSIDWRGVTYSGLDGELLTVVDINGRERPVLGFKDINEGRVYYLGFGWLIHAVTERDQAALSLVDTFFDRAAPSRDIHLSPLDISNFVPSSDHWGFDYNLDVAGPVLISETWSPHWRITVDDEPIDVNVHENLILVDLPAGEHRVSINYGSTPIQWFGLGITLLALLLVAVALWFWEQGMTWLGRLDQRAASYIARGERAHRVDA